MSSNDSDVPVVDDDGPDLQILEIDEVLKNIKTIISNNSSSTDHLKRYILDVERKISKRQRSDAKVLDKDLIKKLILKHPYFKNHCNYSIRMITIIKYLKKKGIDINISNIDEIVEDIILSIDDVEKIGYGKYFKKK